MILQILITIAVAILGMLIVAWYNGVQSPYTDIAKLLPTFSDVNGASIDVLITEK